MRARITLIIALIRVSSSSIINDGIKWRAHTVSLSLPISNQMYPHTCNCISMENDVSSMIRTKTQRRKMNRKPLEQLKQLSHSLSSFLFPHHYDGLRLFINFDICDDDAPLQFQLIESIEISLFIYNKPCVLYINVPSIQSI